MTIEPGVGALRPKTSNSLQWRERSTGDADTDTEIVLEDKDAHGIVRARFETPDAVFEAAREDVPAYYETTPDGYVVHRNGEQKTYETKGAMKQDFKPIRPPFIPEREFTDASGDTRLPTEDDFIFIVFPDDNNDEYERPHIYEHGELRPLIPDDNEGEVSDETETDTDQQRHSPDESHDTTDNSTTEIDEESESSQQDTTGSSMTYDLR